MEAALRHSGSPLFEATTPDAVRQALLGLGPRLIGDLRRDLDDALRGSEDGVRRYVSSYRSLSHALLGEAHRTLPAAVIAAGNGRLAIADANGRPAPALFGVLQNTSVEAPFTPWVNAYDQAEAVALHAANSLRLLIGAPVLSPPAEAVRPPVDDVAAQRFQRRVRLQLSRDDENPLERLMRVFDLSKSELGRLFGVRRQAIDGWLMRGAPADRQEKLATLLALADLLERKLKPDRIPGVARRPAEAYGGRTMLELIAADRQRELLGIARASFDWSQAA